MKTGTLFLDTQRSGEKNNTLDEEGLKVHSERDVPFFYGF